MSSAVEYPQGSAVAAPIPSKVITITDASAKSASARCSSCTMRAVCMPADLTSSEMRQLDSLIYSTRTVKRGETLYRTNDDFRSLYAVRTGSFKTVITDRDGGEQVIGFHLIGETLGLDGVYGEHYNCDAIALEDSTVCIVPFRLLEGMCREVPAMQHHVHRMMSSEIVRESGIMMLLGAKTAEQRLAAFLLNLSKRMKLRGYSASEFYLRMTREEMGSYLGMKLETVSRMFSKLQREGVVDTHGKQVRIVDFGRLSQV
ncbi:helix-turn-helix domain-containing protein [Trinickia dinghuensis]|uniref:Crp/Fnr family transcriptional regulator n=1 Tax=Trinickia dinghuensis TaxID=2291023 RepID=A0A3D8K207_9BURK|nr:helix-turn-helix domain-containing protein [Trinickia dinghuensis]RDU99348.1 Crp/Fnr family transcriptional regulator [Trinickia dinghuensis]